MSSESRHRDRGKQLGEIRRLCSILGSVTNCPCGFEQFTNPCGLGFVIHNYKCVGLYILMSFLLPLISDWNIKSENIQYKLAWWHLWGNRPKRLIVFTEGKCDPDTVAEILPQELVPYYPLAVCDLHPSLLICKMTTTLAQPLHRVPELVEFTERHKTTRVSWKL